MIVGCAPDLDICHDNNHAINVCASDPEGAWLTLVVVNRIGTLQRGEADYLKHKSLASAVEDPAPESVLTKVQVFQTDLEVFGVTQ